MDIGKPRNAADVLHIAGFKYASTLAAAISWAYLLDTDPYNRETLQPDFVLELARGKYADIESFLKFGREINKQFSHPAGQVAALIYHFAKHDSNKAKDFVRAWQRGDRNGKYQCRHCFSLKEPITMAEFTNWRVLESLSKHGIFLGLVRKDLSLSSRPR
jgi:hypothetical protein